MTLIFEDIKGVLEIKGNLNFNQFPETLFFPASDLEPTIVNLIFRRVGFVKIPYMLISNTDISSQLVFQTSETDSFSVTRWGVSWLYQSRLAVSKVQYSADNFFYFS